MRKDTIVLVAWFANFLTAILITYTNLIFNQYFLDPDNAWVQLFFIFTAVFWPLVAGIVIGFHLLFFWLFQKALPKTGQRADILPLIVLAIYACCVFVLTGSWMAALIAAGILLVESLIRLVVESWLVWKLEESQRLIHE